MNLEDVQDFYQIKSLAMHPIIHYNLNLIILTLVKLNHANIISLKGLLKLMIIFMFLQIAPINFWQQLLRNRLLLMFKLQASLSNITNKVSLTVAFAVLMQILKCLLLDMELSQTLEENTTSFKTHGEHNGENKDT